MLNFAEQTGSGAVIVVWSFLFVRDILQIIKLTNCRCPARQAFVRNGCSRTHPLASTQHCGGGFSDRNGKIDVYCDGITIDWS